jgi:hypothetical protein
MIKFTVGLLGLIAIASAHDNVSLLLLVAAATPFLTLMIASIRDIAE